MKPLQFSYSFLQQYDACPEQARHLYVLRTYKKEWPAGIDIHKHMENRFRYSQPLPAELAHAEPLAISLVAQGKPETEVSLAVDRNLQPTKSYDGWLRGKWDLIMRWPERGRAFIGDWKSGKVRETPDQIEIGALLLMAADPRIEEVHGANLWIGNGQAKVGLPYHIRRSEPRWPKWLHRMYTIEKLDRSEPWEKRESALCSWCPVTVCEFHKEHK